MNLQYATTVANGSGLAVRTGFNLATESILSQFSGPTDPATMSPNNAFPYMVWADTNNNLVKQRTADNTAWIIIGSINTDGTFSINAQYIKTNQSGNLTSLNQAAVNAELDSRIGAGKGSKNKLINSGFVVNQRGYSSGLVRASGLYAHDRWKAGASGGTYTFTQSGGPVTNINITAGSFQQVIEGINIEGGTYTLSWAGTAQGRVNGGSYNASPLTVTGITLGTNVTVEFNTGTLGIPQFEPGLVATPFEIFDYPIVLQKCRRYGRPMPSQVLGQAVGGTVAWHSLQLDVPMRTIPTLNTTSGFTTWNASAVSLASTPAIGGLSDNVLSISSTVASGLIAGNAAHLTSPAGAFLSCEL